MKIKNFKELNISSMREDALMIADTGLEAIDSQKIIRESIKLDGNSLCVQDKVCSLQDTDRVFVVGVGKCSLVAVEALEGILGKRISGGIVIDVQDPSKSNLRYVEYMMGTHPMPSEQNIEAACQIHAMLGGVTEKDLVICLISGGGSTLLCLPEAGMMCVNEEAVLRQLFKAGATIQEINTIRKHTSLLRGGQLAKQAYPAQVFSLIFSDVPGDDLSCVASGPTVKDDTTVACADEILIKYNILKKSGLEHCGLMETPKEDKYFEKVYNILISSNQIAIEAMKQEAEERGYETEVCSKCLTGEAREVASGVVKNLHSKNSGTAIIYGGETTVVVRGKGKGGRNREMALAALQEIRDDELLLAIASDGNDHGEYAGAVVDKYTKEKVKSSNLVISDFLDNNNAAVFFEKVGGHILTGQTGSNVSDLTILIKEK